MPVCEGEGGRTWNRPATYVRMFLVAIGFCAVVNFAVAEDCPAVRDVGRQSFSNFSVDFPANLAWVSNPSLAKKPLRIDVQNSSNFYPLDQGGCKSIRRSELRNATPYGYFWFVLNNAIIVTEDTEIEGRSFVAIQVDARYRGEPSTLVLSIFRNSSKKGQPLIWERDDNPIRGMRPTVVNMSVTNWNDAHQKEDIGDNDKALFPKSGRVKLLFHATPVEGEKSTWDFREKFILNPTNDVRKVSNLLMSFLVADAELGGSGVPFQIRAGDLNNLTEVSVRVISEITDLNFTSRLVINDN